MAHITMKALLETGVHFGHRTQKWNPKMSRYIFTERNGIHILDLHQTLEALTEAYELVRDVVMDGGHMLFVGTKRQAQETIAREATRCNMPYVNERWLGGALTNWRTIRERIGHLKDLEARRDAGEFDLLTKKEALTLTREIDKLNLRLGGIREMRGIPNLLFVVDVQREHTAVHEASILGIPIVGMVDTNGDPDLIDYVIPSNDDAIRAIKLITGLIADAVLEGLAQRKDAEVEGEAIADYAYALDDEGQVRSDEDFLGQSTLAKIKSGDLFPRNREDDDELDEADDEGDGEDEVEIEEEEDNEGEGEDDEEEEKTDDDEDEEED